MDAVNTQVDASKTDVCSVASGSSVLLPLTILCYVMTLLNMTKSALIKQ